MPVKEFIKGYFFIFSNLQKDNCGLDLFKGCFKCKNMHRFLGALWLLVIYREGSRRKDSVCEG